MRHHATRFGALVAAVAAALGSLTIVGAAGVAAGSDVPRSIVFVHGFSGSGAQFETQARRFASNGYDDKSIAVVDYDSTFGSESTDQVFTRLDGIIEGLLERSGGDQVDLLGHSLGTRMMQEYLRSSPERAARVAHYVNLDGFPSGDLPGGVETLAIWGRGDPARQIVGAENVRLDDQTHTQTVTSPETFVEIYSFFNDETPKTTKILPERDGSAALSGRAVLFPQNAGVDGATLEIYEVDETGHRTAKRPVTTLPLRGTGQWGPFEGEGDQRYEFAIVREGAAVHHLYYEPFLRDDRWIRLLTSPPGAGIGALVTTSDKQSGLVVQRYREWWGDQGDESDVLSVDGENVHNPANTPIDKRAIGLFLFDDEDDGASDLSAPIPTLAALPFITGADVFIPASPRGKDTISVRSTPRGGKGKVKRMDVPAWPSATDRTSIQFSEHLQNAR
jgi:pimeloyl-ACP methyl ester carboxylesterase